jgi:predicted nucleotidyltransferase
MILDEKIEKHDTLNPLLWDNDKKTLLPEVSKKLKAIVDEFVSYVKEGQIKIKVKDIVLIGSNANYNYTEDSDIDLHIICDSSEDCNEKHLPKIYDAYKSMFNGVYDLTINGVPVEIYVEMDKPQGKSGGVFSIQDNKWLKEPSSFDIPEINQDEFDKEFKDWEDRYFNLIDRIKAEMPIEVPLQASGVDVVTSPKEQTTSEIK